MTDIKKRAERNGKVRRTISKIEQTIAKLERTKNEYMQKAVTAKSRGDTALYSLAKSGLNATLSQIKRAKEMLLNIQITAELQKMGETNSDFLSGMSVLAKRIGKLNKQSNFVKLQKEIDKALTGMQEAQAGLDGFLQNSDAAFAAISSSPSSLSDDQIDRLINGQVSEHEILMDEQIEQLMTASRGTDEKEQTVVGAPPAPPTPPVQPAPPTARNDAFTPVMPRDERRDDLLAKPFPEPRGTFDFAPVYSAPITADYTRGALAVPSGVTEPMYITGEVTLFSKTPNIAACGAPADIRDFVDRVVCTQLVTLTAATERIVLVDLNGSGLDAYNGAAHMSCNAIKDATGAMAAISALTEEANRRFDMFAAAGASDINTYNMTAERKLPYLLFVITGSEGVSGVAFDRAYSALARQGGACGIFTVLGMGKTVSPILSSVTSPVPCAELAPGLRIDGKAISDIVSAVGGATL